MRKLNRFAEIWVYVHVVVTQAFYNCNITWNGPTDFGIYIYMHVNLELIYINPAYTRTWLDAVGTQGSGPSHSQ